MEAEISKTGEYTLYLLYLLLIVAISSFLYILRKKQLSTDSSISIKSTNYKSAHTKIDASLSDRKNLDENEISSDSIKSVQEQKEQKIVNLDQNDTNEEDKIVITSCLPVYKNDMPVIDEVKSEYFEYFKGNKLLIVEDNNINQKILLSVLKSINTPIDVADNGQEAIKKVLEENNKYDMILMDISMPVMDGIKATKEIRQNSKYDDIPIVTVTAFTSGLEIGQMFEVGANAFLTKPLDVHKLFLSMLLYLDNKKSDLSIEEEFDIVGINLDETVNSMHADSNAIKETIEEFLNKFSSLQDRIPKAIEENNLVQAEMLLDELDMILDLIGAKRMQIFIEEMKVSLKNNEEIEYFKILFIAQYKALLNTYRKYVNSL